MTQFKSNVRRRVVGALLSGSLIVCLAGCAPGAGLPALPVARDRSYRLDTGDQVRVVVFDQKQLSADYDIGQSGMVDIPLLGPVRARGRTARNLAIAIEAGLTQHGILRRPKVAVDVRHYRPFSILGEVNKPGQYPFEPGMTVLTAVSIADGFTYRAMESRVGVVRVKHGVAREYRALPNAFVSPGDVIKVFERHF